MMGIFQTAEGGWHWPSILQFFGFIIGGVFLIIGLWLSRAQRVADGPWVFEPAQVSAFTSAIESAPKGKLAIEFSDADRNRSFIFAERLKTLLEGAHYEIWGYMPAFREASGPRKEGIIIGTKPTTTAMAEGLRKAFAAANIPAVIKNQNNQNYEEDRAVIYVGAKPRN